MAKKNHTLPINEDITLIERIALELNKITPNHNKICAYTNKCKCEY